VRLFRQAAVEATLSRVRLTRGACCEGHDLDTCTAHARFTTVFYFVVLAFWRLDYVPPWWFR
jgi:hypothetical protein